MLITGCINLKVENNIVKTYIYWGDTLKNITAY